MNHPAQSLLSTLVAALEHLFESTSGAAREDGTLYAAWDLIGLPGRPMLLKQAVSAARQYLTAEQQATAMRGYGPALSQMAMERARELAGMWSLRATHPKMEGQHIPTDLPERMLAEIDRLNGELAAMRVSSRLRMEADQRAIARWKAAHPARANIWPDHTDMVTWMLDQLGRMRDDPDNYLPDAWQQRQPPIRLRYRNHAGQVGVRTIVPIGAPFFGSTRHHPVEQWILPVWDLDKDAVRLYSLQDCRFFLPGERGESIDAIQHWQRDALGEPTDPRGALLRLVNEVTELLIAGGVTFDEAVSRMAAEWKRQVLKGAVPDDDNVASELADVFVVLCRIAASFETDFQLAIDQTMAVNRTRTNFARGANGHQLPPVPVLCDVEDLDDAGRAELLAGLGVPLPPPDDWRNRLLEAWTIQQAAQQVEGVFRG